MKRMHRNFPFSLLLLIVLTVGCTEKPKVDNQTTHNKTDYTDPSLVGSEVEKMLETALEKEHVIFLVLVGNSPEATSKAMELAEKTAKTVDKSVVIKLNRTDPAHTETVDVWQLSGIELPAILVVSATGIPVGGYTLAEASVNKLIALVPSPKMDEAFVALNAQRPVLLIISHKDATDRNTLLENCRLAVGKLGNKPVIIEVDKSLKEEQSLLSNFGINPTEKESSVVVINANGETTDRFKRMVSVKELITSINKKGESACCAPGESCPPTN